MGTVIKIKSRYEGKSILDVPLVDVFDEWERRTDKYQDAVMVRTLALYDRFFLLVQLCSRRDMLHPWIYDRCRMVEKDPDGYLDIYGREHYKSTIITFGGTIQELMRDPDITVGIFSHTRGISRKFLRQIKFELESNRKLQQLFPDVLYDDPEKQATLWSLDNGLVVKRKTNPKEATVEAWGLVDGQPVSTHFKLMIYDDVVVKESVSTPEQIAKTTEMWELSDNLGAQGGRKWHTGTRYSYADTYEEIIKRGAVKLRLYPATDDGTITGKPVLFTQSAWDEKVVAQGEATISCQMLGNPLAGNQRMFNVEDIQVYEVRPATLAVYILGDPARSKKKGSANTAYAVIGVDYAMNKYLLDGYNHKMDLLERWEKLTQLYVKWKSQVGIQAVYVGYEAFGAQADLDYFIEQQRVNKIYFEITELSWPRDGEGAKVDRVQRLGPDLRGHKFFVPYNTDPEKLTANQRKMKGGYEYRIAKPIRRRDESNNIYDLTDQFKNQVHFFPFTPLVDLIDATSRIYDMEVRAPAYNEPRYAEPSYV